MHAQGGLLISEATYISTEAMGYPSAPGIWTQEQVQGWKKVTSAVHKKGGLIFCQLWHVGRIAHPSYAKHPIVRPSDPKPSISASAVGMKGKTMTYEGRLRNAVPRALEMSEVPRLIEDYKHAARCAMEAGFDGVEIHGAHGYLLDQFLNNGT